MTFKWKGLHEIRFSQDPVTRDLKFRCQHVEVVVTGAEAVELGEGIIEHVDKQIGEGLKTPPPKGWDELQEKMRQEQDTKWYAKNGRSILDEPNEETGEEYRMMVHVGHERDEPCTDACAPYQGPSWL